MKKLIFILGIFASFAFFLISCVEAPQQQQPQQSQQTQPSAPLKTSSSQEEIVFDDPSGQVSLARNFYFIFDGSGSMNENCSGKRKIEGAKEATLLFLEKVPKDVNIGLLLLGTSSNSNACQELIPLGPNNHELFKQKINSIQPDDGTPIGTAITIATQKIIAQYKKQMGYGEYRIVIITDGEATDGPNNMKNSCKKLQSYGFISLYSIGLCLNNQHTLKDFAFSYRDANNYQELQKALEETLGETDVFDPSVFDEALFEDE